jgi:hypothetical protein
MVPSLLEPRVGDLVIADEDFPASLEHFASYSGELGYTNRIGRRQTFSAGYSYRGRTAAGVLGRFEKHGASARLNHEVGRGLSLRVGYGYSQAYYDERDRRYTGHNIDAGIDYSRALSFSRRTMLSFGTGTSAARSGGSTLRYYATGMARLNHEIGRTWLAALSYSRGLQYVETWPEPLFADSATAMVAGLLSRRSQVQVAVRALNGNTQSTAAGNISSYSGSAALSLALNRFVSTGLTYAYYQHGFASTIALAPGYPDDFDGHTIRASINLWAPIFQRARRP